MEIVGLSIESTSEKLTFVNGVPIGWSHLIFTVPGLVIVGLLAKSIKT